MSTTVATPALQKVSESSAMKRLHHEEVARLLPLLETVERGQRLGDDIPLIAQNVVRNEQCKDDFFKPLRAIVGTEPSAQRKLIEELLVSYFERLRVAKKAQVRAGTKRIREARELVRSRTVPS